MIFRRPRRLPNMELTLTTFITLDGTMQAPGGPEEDTSGGFAYGGWTAAFFDEDAGKTVSGWFERADAFLLGRRTYDIFAAYWPQVTDPEHDIAVALNSKPKYVASRGNPALPWDGSTLIGGDVVAGIQELKARTGRELQVHGSGDLAQTLLQHGLVDELRLITFPVLAPGGRRLFGEGTRPGSLQLTDHQATSTGAVIAVYRPAGALKVGDYGIDDGREVTIDVPTTHA